MIGCLVSHIFLIHCFVWLLKVAEAFYLGYKHRLRSTHVQDLHRAAPATFRMQIEQIQMHLEQPQIRFETKCEI
jgi:hypothetical protein